MLAQNVFGLPSMGWRYPFAEMDRLARQMDWMNNAIFGQPGARMMMPKVFPAVNITENKEKYFVRAELPGIKTEDIKLEVTGSNLSISGERKISFEGEAVKYHRREREAGRFSRVISLSDDVEADSVEAKMKDGLLTVAITKSATAKARQIKVKAS